MSRRGGLAAEGGILGVLLLSALLAWPPGVAHAQNDRNQRQKFVEGLLQTLIDSQLPPEEATRRPPSRGPAPNTFPPGRNRGELRQTQQQLEGFAEETRQLLQALQGEWSRLSVAGPLIGDTAKVYNTAASLARQAGTARDLDPIAAAYAQLNADWRGLAHRIRQTHGLSSFCLARADAIDRHDRQLCRLLGVEAQMDRAALERQVVTLTVDLRNLCEDLEADLPPTPRQEKILEQCREAQSRAGEVVEAAFGRADPTDVQSAYRNFRQAWSAAAVLLQGIDVPHIRRDQSRIWQADRVMHELLWIDYEIDSSHLVSMAKVLQRHIDELYDAVSLDDLIDLPPARRIVPTASEFYGYCEYFILCAENRESLKDLSEAYWDLDAAWPAFSACFAEAKSPDVLHAMSEIERSVASLRELLGIPPELNWEFAQQRSARLEYLAHGLEGNLATAERSSGGYSSSVRARIATAASKGRGFCTTCRELHEMVVARGNRNALAEKSRLAAVEWGTLLTDLNAVFRPEDVRASTSEIGEALVELQATFGP